MISTIETVRDTWCIKGITAIFPDGSQRAECYGPKAEAVRFVMELWPDQNDLYSQKANDLYSSLSDIGSHRESIEAAIRWARRYWQR